MAFAHGSACRAAVVRRVCWRSPNRGAWDTKRLDLFFTGALRRPRGSRAPCLEGSARAPRVAIVQGGAPLFAHSRPLIDYITLVSVFQGCADLAAANITAPLNLAQRAALRRPPGQGPPDRDDTGRPSAEAQDHQRLRHPARAEPGAARLLVRQRPAIDLGDLHQYLRPLQRARNLCSYSSRPMPASPVGLPSARGRQRGPDLRHQQRHPTDVRRRPDQQCGARRAEGGRGSTTNQNLDGALCLRSIATGKDPVTGAPLTGTRASRRSHPEGVEDILPPAGCAARRPSS